MFVVVEDFIHVKIDLSFICCTVSLNFVESYEIVFSKVFKVYSPNPFKIIFLLSLVS